MAFVAAVDQTNSVAVAAVVAMSQNRMMIVLTLPVGQIPTFSPQMPKAGPVVVEVVQTNPYL